MALTDDEKHDVVRALGYPGAVLIPTSSAYSNIVSGRLTNLNSPIETDVRSLLTRLEKLDSRLDGALDRASTKRVGDIEINPEEMTILRAERRRVIKEIANLLDLMIYESECSNMVGIIV